MSDQPTSNGVSLVYYIGAGASVNALPTIGVNRLVSTMRNLLSALVWFAFGAVPASADVGDIELLDFELEHVLAPGSQLLRPGMHVHNCGNDAVDVYVAARVSLDGGIAVASRRATLWAFRILSEFAYGSVGSRQQESLRVETPTGTEAVGIRIRNRVRTAGVVSGLRPAARLLGGESLLMVFVLPLSGPAPVADCLPEDSRTRVETIE